MSLRLFGKLVSRREIHQARALARQRRKPQRRSQLRYFRILRRVRARTDTGSKHGQPWAVFVHRFFSFFLTKGRSRNAAKTFNDVLRVITTLAALLLTSPASAQSYDSGPKNLTLLQGDTLNEAFFGRTMDGTYKAMRERTGTSNFTETFFKDGTTDYREGNLREGGLWQLSGPPGFESVICFRYQGTMAGPPSCFTVFREGTCLYSYAPRLIKDEKPQDTNRWSAKTVIRGELSSCDDLVG